MNQIRTTISLDSDLHRLLLAQAVSSGVSLSELVNSRLANKNAGERPEIVAKQVADDLVFFRELGKRAGKTDWAKLVREERDRDRR